MIIRLEPKEWLMHAVFLFFDEDTPDPEDQAIRDYLTEHKLAPKRETTTSWDEREWSVMYFGGCYLGRHLGVISEIQRRIVEEQEAQAVDSGV